MNWYREINLKSLFLCLWHKVWIIALSALVAGAAAFAVTDYAVAPQYRATISLYVNNTTESTSTLTSSDVAAAKLLVNTYITIIQSDSFLDGITDGTGLGYSNDRIRDMMSAQAVNGTEVFTVSITGPSPQDCALIANRIAEMAPDKISEIIEGSSVKVVDTAKVPTEPVSPGKLKNALIAALLGLFFSCSGVVVSHILDMTIYGEDDIAEFCSLPILGIFPDLGKTARSDSHYGGEVSGK